MDEYIEISIDVFDQLDQRAKVKKNLTVEVFVDEILREFDDLDRKNPQSYGLFLKGNTHPLDLGKTLEQLDIHGQDELVFRYARSLQRAALPERQNVFLIDDSTHKVFELHWSPAIIGRPDSSDPAHNELLAVNLEPYPEGRKASRRHAQITYEDGQYYLESLSDTNPTFINAEHKPISGKRRIQSSTSIIIGKGLFKFYFIVRDLAAQE
jgi:hypothetical protein